MTTQELLQKARAAKWDMAAADTATKNRALLAMADALEARCDDILAANALDLKAARGTISEVMLDRLALSPDRIAGMAAGLREVAELPDPVGAVLSRVERPNGLVIEKTAVPMGVIAIIYESRPNVTSDAAALALKAGSACVLRGGKEAHRSAAAIVAALKEGLSTAGLNPDALQLVEDTSRASANELMAARGLVDLLIPRGGAGLIRACVDNAAVPVLEHNRFGHPVQLRLDPEAAKIIDGTPAGPADFDTEFLDYILAVRVVDSLEEAVGHIAAHSTGHSEAIVTGDERAAHAFLTRVDSAAVYWNASTRFTDGGEFGLGCEMGISTQKLHARGPLGLGELCSFKFVIKGAGQTR